MNSTTTTTAYSELPTIFNVNQLAKTFGISRAGAYNLLASRGFPTLQIGNGKFVTSSLKTKHSKRSIQLPNETLEIIKEYKEKQIKLGLLPEQGYIDDKFIFYSPFGTLLDPDSARKMLKRILKRA